jgi:hypothetical protein
MNKMQALSAALRAEEEEKNAKKSGTTRKASGGDNASYPFWDIKEGKTASVRFLPDADPDNQWFWKEREIIKLPFDGIVGGEYPTNDAVEVTCSQRTLARLFRLLVLGGMIPTRFRWLVSITRSGLGCIRALLLALRWLRKRLRPIRSVVL